jgi:hypothetical protein
MAMDIVLTRFAQQMGVRGLSILVQEALFPWVASKSVATRQRRRHNEKYFIMKFWRRRL